MELDRNFKIFLVDDDIFCLKYTENHLKTSGLNDVHLYTNGSDCINGLTKDPDIIFLDHMMDEMNGFEVLKKIKRFNPNIHVVMLSGQENIETAVNSLKYGALDYIIKGKGEKEKMLSVIHRIAELEKLAQKKSSFFQRIFSQP